MTERGKSVLDEFDGMMNDSTPSKINSDGTGMIGQIGTAELEMIEMGEDITTERVGLILQQPPEESNEENESRYAKISEIAEAHEKNRLENNLFSSSKELLTELQFIVPLNGLYKLISSCNYNVSNTYCPVLVQIKDEEIKDQSGKEYLLQVWDREGQMLFERPLD